MPLIIKLQHTRSKESAWVILCMYSDINGIKLDSSNRKISGHCPNMWKLNDNTFINNTCVKEKIKREVVKYFWVNENGNISNVWDTSKAVHPGKFSALNAYVRKEEGFQIIDISFYLKKLDKIDQIEPQVRRIRKQWNRKRKKRRAIQGS